MDSALAERYSDEAPGTFNSAGVLLTDAVIMASGGDHLELGDDLNLLAAPYSHNHHLVASGALLERLQAYDDFLVAYENLLRGDLRNAERTVRLSGLPVSTNGDPGTVWAFVKSGAAYDAIHLINLPGQTSPLWRDDVGQSPWPPLQRQVDVQYYYGEGSVDRVSVASPDDRAGKAQSLSFTLGRDDGGNFVRFTLPRLEIWDMVQVHKRDGLARQGG